MSDEASQLHSGATRDADEDLNEIFDAAINEALSRDEITLAAQQAQLDLEFLRVRAAEASADIWQTVMSERDNYTSDVLYRYIYIYIAPQSMASFTEAAK